MICTQFLHTFVLFRYMKTVNFEKTTVLCTFCLPHKNKKRPRKGRFLFCYKNFATSVFRTSGLLQVFFVQVFCYKCFCRQKFCYKCFCRQKFCYKCGYTSVLHTRVLQSTKQAQNCFCNVGVFTHGKFYLLQGALYKF